MAKHPLWHDEYWLFLIGLYQKQPQGVKPLYSRGLVDLALELHIEPEFLYAQMFKLRNIDTPSLQQYWDLYANNASKLKREISKLRHMKGFGKPSEFYEGVEVNESWEKDYKPIAVNPTDEDSPLAASLTPVKLIMILDLYFRLTPITMVPETPEVTALGKLIHLTARQVVEVMEVFRCCDPYLSHGEMLISPLLTPCMQIWKRFGSENPQKLAATALQLREYFAR
jgi:hypothetical protein